MGASPEEREMDGPWADSFSISCSISTLLASRSATSSAAKAWKAEAVTGVSAGAPGVGVDGVVGDDADEEVVCDEVDGDEVPEEEVVEALDAGEAEGDGEGFAPLPPLLPLPFLDLPLPPGPSGLV
jgi:hypothetical protein